MGKISKACILTFFIIFIVAVAGFLVSDEISNPTADIYIENNTVTCSIFPYCDNQEALEESICNYILSEMEKEDSDINTIKQGIKEIGSYYGIDNLNINIDSELGKDKISIIYTVDGRSMVPTLQDGQEIIVEKTKDISVNDIVAANSPQYGNIVKRVDQIKGNKVHLISDNKNIEYEEINGIVYETKGITTWVDISDIYGVVRSY